MTKALSPKNVSLFVPAKIGIIGFGIVGQALANGFNKKSKNRDQIRFFDKFKDSLPLKEVVEASDFIFICLPTPMKYDESGIDLSIIDENIAQITKYTDNTDKIIVIKSTVVPGTTAEYQRQNPKSHFAFNPEFLTEANFMHDFLNADRTIIGASNDLVARSLASLYMARFPKSPISLTDTTSAEMVKIAANAYLASKVTMSNIFAEGCKKLGIEWEEVRKMVAADPRIGNSHTSVTTTGGWGGKCFPKDWVNLKGLWKKLGIDTLVLDAIWEDNKLRRKEHDWIDIPFAVEKRPKTFS